MNFGRWTQGPAADTGPHPAYDESTGENYYGDDVEILTTNPPDFLLAPASFVSHVDQQGTPGRGPENFQLFQSAETSMVLTNPADEQGFGRAPTFKWAKYPHVQQFNDTRLADCTLQDGQGFHGFYEREQRSPIWPEGYENYRQQPQQHQWWPSVATVNQPETPAFVEQVPPLY